MPVLTAPQLFWTGLATLVLGVLGSAGAQALYMDRLWASPTTFAFLSAAATGLTVLGAALVAGSLVFAGARRASAARHPGHAAPAADARATDAPR